MVRNQKSSLLGAGLVPRDISQFFNFQNSHKEVLNDGNPSDTME